MKKSSKILGSLAVSAALVMGTAVPAFADTSAVASDNKAATGAQTGITYAGTDKSTGTGETAVNITTYTSQISVTVPLNVTLSLDTTGGAGYAPTNYKIVNGTVVPVKVTKAVATPDASNKYGFGTTASTVTGGTAVSTGTIGDVYAKFTPNPATGSTATTAMELKAGDQALDWVIAAKPAGATSVTTWHWNGSDFADDAAGLASFKTAIAGESYATAVGTASDWNSAKTLMDSLAAGALTSTTTGSAGTELPFTIAASSSVLKNAEATTNNAAKIVYTVAVA